MKTWLVLLCFVSATASALTAEEWIKDLDRPWDLAFAPDRTLFFTEKCDGLSVRLNDGKIRRIFEPDDLQCPGQSGMHGVALDPSFQENRRIYVFMTSKRTNSNLVVRLKVNADYSGVTDRTDIVTDIPLKVSRNAWGGAGSHSGGRIRFGPDKFLYVTTGDNHNGPLPQDLNRLGGKVLRIDTEGKAAPGNNAPKGADPRIYAYGFRNVQGLTFHPKNGVPHVCEHGPNHSDEITALKPGGNGGWDPKPAAGVKCDDNYCGYTSNNPEGKPTSMTDLKKFPGALKPLVVVEDSQGMSACTFWNGKLYVGIMAAQRLMEVEGTKTSYPKAPGQRYRSLVVGPDGLLYAATDQGKIWRIKN